VHTPTVVFVPRYQYPEGYEVTLSEGSYERDEERQLLRINAHGLDGELSLRIGPRGA
jgi:Glycoside hydrolase family 5 C-terminal domain